MHIRCPHCQNAIEVVDDQDLAQISCPSCGSDFDLLPETQSFWLSKRAIGHFDLLDTLGSGGYGTVWKARDTKLDRLVAIKVPRLERLNNEDAELFLREARAAAQLRHPHIVGVHEVGRDDGTLYIVSDFVQGITLADRLTAGPFAPREAAELLATVADAVHHAHEAGVIHRDLKPQNIMLDGRGQPLVMDFGLAKRDAGEITMTIEGKVLGTPAYMSPEQARGEGHRVDRRTDVYSLGVILFELLTGERPFRGNQRMLLHQVMYDEPPSLRQLNNRVPRDVETICLKALEKQTPKRYATAADFAADLHRFLKGEPIIARPVSAPERAWRWCQRNKTMAALTMAVLLLLISLTVGSSIVAVLVGRESRLLQQQASAQKERDDAWRRAQDLEAEMASLQLALQALKNADQSSKSAADQRRLALDTINDLAFRIRSLRDTPATQTVKQNLLRTAIDGLRKVAQSANDSATKDESTAQTHERIGDMLQSLGQHAEARSQYEASLAICKTLADAAPGKYDSQRRYALAVSKLGDISLLQGHKDQARGLYAEALRIRQAVAASFPHMEQVRIELATSYVTLGNLSEFSDAEKCYLEALKLRQELAATAPPESRAARLRDVWIICNRLAELSQKQNDLAAALKYLDQALVQAADLEKLMPGSIRAKLDLALSHIHIGNVKSHEGDTAAAKDSYGRAVEILQPLAKQDPQNLELITTLALVLARHGDHVEAADKADALRTLQNYRTQYNAACCLSLCSAAISASRLYSELTKDEQNLAESYADRAIQALNQAVKLGFKDLQAMKEDPDLIALASHPGFQALLDPNVGGP